MIDNELAWVHNRKAVLQNDRLRWLELMEGYYKLFKEFRNPAYKDLLKFCGEQSVEIKKELTKIK